MKVCIVSLNIVPYFTGDRSRFYGGAEVQGAFVAEALRGCGQQVSLVVSDLSRPDVIPFPAENAFASDDGIRGLRFFHPRWTGVVDALGRADADVYYQHCAGMVTGLTAWFCRRNKRVFVYGAGSDVDFSVRDVAVHGFRDRMMFRYGLRASSGFVVQNERQRAVAQEFGTPMTLIPTGVKPVDSIPDAPGTDIVWIGAMWTVKRPELFLELARRMPDKRFRMIGGGGELAHRIDAEAASIPNVELVGRIPHDELGGVLRRAALLVNTSSVEGFPNAYLDAWNHGLPVVAFQDIDGMIRGEGVGAVCANLDDMVAAIRGLAENTDALRAIRASARALVQERFSPRVIGPKYMHFFEQLLSAGTTVADRSGVAVQGR